MDIQSAFNRMIRAVPSVNRVVFVTLLSCGQVLCGQVVTMTSYGQLILAVSSILILVVRIHTLLLPLAQRLEQKPFSLWRTCCGDPDFSPTTVVPPDITLGIYPT